MKVNTIIKPKLTALLIATLISGCAVTPKKATQEEVTARVKADFATMHEGHEAVTKPIDLEEAVARALKYNLDYRLKKMESAMALGIADASKYDMWPKLLANAGYNTRNNFSGGTSIGIEDGIESLRASTSQQKHFAQTSAEFSWNVLDFGVSYFRAKQKADQYLIAEERRRKLVQNIMQDVRAAYWRALGAQRLATDTADIMKRAKAALAKSREAESQKIISPALALNYQRALLDATSLLNHRKQDLAFAKSELAALMSLPPDEAFTLAETKENKLAPVPNKERLIELEELALLQRPELREEDYTKRITAAEARKQMLSFLPNFNIASGFNTNTNDYAYNNSWRQSSVGVTWNLLKLISLPAVKRTLDQQVKVDEARRLALSMAVVTQLRISMERYRLAVEDYKLAETAADVDKRLAAHTKASMSAKLASELEVIRTEARAVLGAYQKANAYASAQVAFGRLYNSLGFDPLDEDFAKDHTIAEIAESVNRHLKETEHEALHMRSHLFGNDMPVALQIQGVNDIQLKQQMKGKLVELLKRHSIVHDEENGLPLTFKLSRENKLDIDKANWKIAYSDKAGKVTNTAEFNTKIPEESRSSVLESTLIAAATAKLSNMKSWLSNKPVKTTVTKQ